MGSGMEGTEGAAQKATEAKGDAGEGAKTEAARAPSEAKGAAGDRAKAPATSASAPKPARPEPLASGAPTASAAAPKEGASAGPIIAVLIVGGLLTAVGVMRCGAPGDEAAEAPAREAAPKRSQTWAVGERIDVDITVLPNDAENLACASTQEVAGRHCGFESPTTVWSKGGDASADALLRPYATTGRARLLAGGLWTSPAIAAQKGTKRFVARCRYTIEGKVQAPQVRWAKDGPWREMKGEWFTGHLADCTVKR